METVELESLAGLHYLSGVDRIVITKEYDDADAIRFILDGKTYTAVENPEDGYRSMLDTILVSNEKLGNEFEPVAVFAHIRESNDDDILDFYDVFTAKLVMSIGTANTKDYYPWFVAEFDPRNLYVNQGT